MTELEDLLAFQLRTAGIRFEREYQAIPNRKYLWDFYIEDVNLLVEVQGGTWVSKTGHTSGVGIQRDCDKGNLADAYGFRHCSFTAQDVRSLKALQTIENAILQIDK